MKVLAIDPGGTTGYCTGVFNTKVGAKEYIGTSDTLKPTSITLQPFQQVDDVDEMWRRLEAFEPRYIIMEDFEFRGGARKGLNLFPVQLIGVARLYELYARHQCALTLQKASFGKSYYTDSMLGKLGFYKRGMPHGMDAMRHLLQWLTFGAGYQFLGKDKIEKFVTVEY